MQKNSTAIKDVLKTVISNISGEKKTRISRIEEAWKAVVDKKAYKHTRLAGLKAGRLVVNIDSSAWMYELNLSKRRLKDALNQRFDSGKDKIEEIVLRIGEID